MRWMSVIGLVGVGVSAGSAALGSGGELAAFGRYDRSHGGPAEGCFSPAQELAAEAQRQAFLASPEGQALGARGFPDARPFRFYPQAGNVNRDLYHVNYVDLDPTAGVLDFDCTALTYNGHRGHDSILRGFDEQEVGVPVFAVADGVVIAMQDGEPDRNTFWDGQPANFVWIDHGQFLTTRYLHLKNGSVVHAVGDTVEAGEQIGLTASSGVSDWPHLHFESRKFSTTQEPMTGPCDVLEDSWWTEQWEVERGFLVRDFGFRRGNMSVGWAGPPFETPRSNHVTFDDQVVSYWMQGLNLPAGSTARFRFFTPAGGLSFDSGAQAIGGGAARIFWTFWAWNIPEMRTLAGEWTVRIDINGAEAVTAQVRVFEKEQPAASVNRPSAPVTATLEPAVPADGDVVWARIDPDLVHDDPDFDVVRYTYRWTVNGKVVREVTSAGHADAIPASYHGPGDAIACEVIAGDGVSAPCPADLSGDGAISGVDLAILLAGWGGGGAADLNGDGATNASDLAIVLAAWGPCP